MYTLLGLTSPLLLTVLKFRYSEKATRFEKEISSYLTVQKSKHWQPVMSEDPVRVKCSIMSSFWRKYIILYLTVLDNVKEIGRFFSKNCDLLRMSELYSQASHRLLLLFRLMNCSVTTKYVLLYVNGIYLHICKLCQQDMYDSKIPCMQCNTSETFFIS